MRKGSGMPQMGAAFAGWMQKIVMTRTQDVIIDGLVSKREVPFSFNGVIQPLSSKDIALKPEGQRAWKWLRVHSFSGSVLKDDDKITYSGEIFKVMGTWDWSLSGY